VRSGSQLSFETPERAVLSLDVVGLGGRVLAFLLDLLFLFLAWVTALLAYSVAGDLLRRVQQLSALAQGLAVAVAFALGWCYDVAFETLWRGQTPGKRILGLRVVRADGAPVGPVESVIRNVARAAEVPLLYAPAVLCVALTRRHQRLGDLLAGTLVVRDRAYDLSRYAPVETTVDPRWASLQGRAALAPDEFERLSDFLGRRGELAPAARRRVGEKIARALAARAGALSPGPGEAEPFLEALAAAQVAEGRAG
jgi:uncharacterized RDD family membrane protein YckC